MPDQGRVADVAVENVVLTSRDTDNSAMLLLFRDELVARIQDAPSFHGVVPLSRCADKKFKALLKPADASP